MMNPYLASKGTVPRLHALSNFILKSRCRTWRTITGPGRVQRRERFIGNCIALRHMLTGRLDPDHVTNIEVQTASIAAGAAQRGPAKGRLDP